MKYRINCNTDQSSIVSFEANDVESLLAEVQDAFSDVINEVICIDRPQVFFPDLASLSTEIYSSAQLKIKQKAQEYTLSCDNPCGVPDLVGLLLEVLENRRCCEQSDVDIGECALSMLKKVSDSRALAFWIA